MSKESNYWADNVAREVVAKFGKKIVVESGISPSGPYHIGGMREVLTADVIKAAIKNAGGSAAHYHFTDDFDPLRKRYPYLPAKFEEYVGRPLFLVPDPEDCHESYAEHYFRAFKREADALGIVFDWQFSAHREYKKGRFTKYIELAIEKADAIKKILKDVSGRELSGEGPLVQILCSNCHRITKTEFMGWDKRNKTITYKCECGNHDVADYSKGEAKLTWRLDWPARWHSLGVHCEPFGREHATKGSSYDTGKMIIEKIFKGWAPYPVPYDTINRKGETKKMSASLGNVVTATEALEVMPPEVLRFFIIRSLPERQLFFDAGLGLFNLIEEFSKGGEFKEALMYASSGGAKKVISTVPFSHLVTAYQTAQGDKDKTFEILNRTGYAKQVKSEKNELTSELKFTQNWLQKFAPEEIKFSVLSKAPKSKLSPDEKMFLSDLASHLKSPKSFNPETIHASIYEAANSAGLQPKAAFTVLYKLFLGKDFGPRLGYFLASLEHSFVLKRLIR